MAIAVISTYHKQNEPHMKTTACCDIIKEQKWITGMMGLKEIDSSWRNGTKQRERCAYVSDCMYMYILFTLLTACRKRCD